MDALIRLLELVRRELQAEDAHLQLGGRGPDDSLRLAHELQPGCQLVVRFAEPPSRPEVTHRRLAELAEAFTATVGDAITQLDTTLARAPAPASDALTQVLSDLSNATGADAALVIDHQSPVLWGSSDPALELRDRPEALRLHDAFARMRTDGLDPLTEATANDPSPAIDGGPRTRARHALRRAERAQPAGAATLVAVVDVLAQLAETTAPPERLPDAGSAGYARKGFGALYEVVLVFTREYSPLRIEGIMRRAVAVVERHVLELPPLDPTPKGGRVVPLHRD